MSLMIVDGTGQGYRAKVSENNRLATVAVTRSEAEQDAVDSNLYFSNSPIITLTSDSASGVLYIKNNEAVDVSVLSCKVTLGYSDQSGAVLVGGSRNTAGGTVESGGTAGSLTNQNFSSAGTIDMDLFYGTEGSALGTPSTTGAYVAQGTQFEVVASRIVLGAGNSFGVQITPPTSNTSMPLTIRLLVAEAGSVDN